MQSQVVLFVLGSLGLVLFGAAVLLASRLVFGRGDPTRDDPLGLTLAVTGWVLIAVGLLGPLFAVFGLLGVPLLIIALVVLAEAAVRHRTSQQYALLWLLAVSAERLIPLVPAIEAFARERRGRFAARARWLTRLLTAGVPLPDALERARGLVPPEVLPTIRVGYQSGALGAALRRAASVRDLRQPLRLAVAGRLIYLLLLVSFGSLIVTYAMARIVPEFEKIFWGYDAELPQITEVLIAASEFVAWHWYLFVPILVVLVLLPIYAVARYLGLVRWDLPGTGRLLRRLDTAAIFEALALAVGQRRPVAEAVAAMARSYPKGSIRRRLRGVLHDLDAGADWCESLFARGLIGRADLVILQAAQRVGNLAWALREMAGSNRRRLAYRLYALVQLLFPPVILVIGGLVMLITVGLFMPLVALIRSQI